MAWEGYYVYGGTEIINVSRTEAYAAHGGLHWFKPIYENEALAPMLGEEYASPFQDDDVPWVDPDDGNSYRFYGCYPLDITGVEDSSALATVTESTLDGGVVGRARHATKAIVFSLALIGADECAVEYGFRWLKAIMAGGPCQTASNQTCNIGSDLCYLNCPPQLDWMGADVDVEHCLDPYLRSMHKTATTVGPVVTGKRTTTDGGCVWVVSMTVVAANPFEFSLLDLLIVGFGDPTVDVPYVGGVVPPGGSFDMDGFSQTEVTCPQPSFQPVFDPLCSPLIAPPPVPNIALSCFEFPVNYVRREFTIPEQEIPLFGEVVPLVRIHTTDKEVRSLRLRFYASPTGRDVSQDPCNFCGDIVFSYIPANSTLIFDGADRQTYVETAGGFRRRADAIVFGSDGGPYEWPELTCGYPYVVTLDLPQTATMPVVDFGLYSRAA